jgi:hypothetical protein
MYVNFQIILKDFLDNESISANSLGSYAKVKLLRKYVTMHAPQKVKKALCNSRRRESQNLLLTYRITFYYIFRNIFSQLVTLPIETEFIVFLLRKLLHCWW